MPVWILVTVVLLGLSAVTFVSAVLLITSGVRGTRRRTSWEARTVVTTAEVIDVRPRRGPNERYGIHAGPVYIPSGVGEPDVTPTFAPVVQFSLPDGRIVQAETITSTRPAPAKKGETVQVRYQVDDPERVDYVGTGPKMWSPIKYAGATILLMMSLVTFAMWFLLVVVLDFRSQ